MVFADIPQFVEQKVCLSCDGCCRFSDDKTLWRPKVFPTEIKELNKQETIGKEGFTQDGYLKTIAHEQYHRCTFFNCKDNTCQIYFNRPFECQIYPVILHQHNRRIYVCVHLSCPYILEHHGTKKFEQYKEDLRRYFFDDNIYSFLRANASSMGDYSVFSDELEILFELQKECEQDGC
ncbi:MAG: YkgJ family cysteine cluster protein [Candidatus Omnitrophica bacterium]|nr:YkgJ family cysteine cluster protein [Candidatus Omnitrophota bacterium]MCB9747192.1 YkgJ family cysteine cluster protein [Candidatus Omnitrophota bacterium]